MNVRRLVVAEGNPEVVLEGFAGSEPTCGEGRGEELVVASCPDERHGKVGPGRFVDPLVKQRAFIEELIAGIAARAPELVAGRKGDGRGRGQVVDRPPHALQERGHGKTREMPDVSQGSHVQRPSRSEGSAGLLEILEGLETQVLPCTPGRGAPNALIQQGSRPSRPQADGGVDASQAGSRRPANHDREGVRVVARQQASLLSNKPFRVSGPQAADRGPINWIALCKNSIALQALDITD